MKSLGLLGTVTAVVVILAACGDDDDATPAASIGTVASSDVSTPPTTGAAAPDDDEAPAAAPAPTARPTTVAPVPTAAPTPTAVPTTVAAGPVDTAVVLTDPTPEQQESSPEGMAEADIDCFAWYSVIDDEGGSLPFQYLTVGGEIGVDQAGAFSSNADSLRSVDWNLDEAAEDGAAWADHFDALAASDTFTQELYDAELQLIDGLQPWCGVGG